MKIVRKYGVISGPFFPVFGPEMTPNLDTFHAVWASDVSEKYTFLDFGIVGWSTRLEYYTARNNW